MVQTEYGLAWALVAAMILLGVLAIALPRPRKSDLPENLERQRKEREAIALRKRMLPQSYRKKVETHKR